MSVVRGSVGSLIDDQVPMICGGCQEPITINACYLYINKIWTPTFPMNTAKVHFFGMPSSPYQYPSHKFYAAGQNFVVPVIMSDFT